MGKNDVSEYIISKPLPTLPVGRVGRQIRSGRLSGQFIPAMPLWWAIAAAKAGTRRRITGTSIVGQILWQQQMMRKSQTLHVSRSVWRKIKLDRRLVNRALYALESTGLITVERFKHSSPAITIVMDESKISLH